ncbi:MAG: VOC family protein [Lacrimispora sphenoides]
MNRINVICLGVRSMEDSIRFYKDGLGFQTNETGYNPPVIFFNTSGGLKLELYPIDLLAKDINNSNPPQIHSGFSGITLAYNVKSKEEVHQVIELARKAGAQVEKEPQDVFWGGYHAYFSDPDGYFWEVAYGPEFKFDENDMLIL